VRADRLVAVLLMLQSRGKVTAAEVAAELEVSERTARRDLEALGMAGLPIYSRQGRDGGWQLAGGGRTDLSGLTAAETRALFLVAGPLSTATPEVKQALRKLVRALPEPFRPDAEAAATALVADPVGWGGDHPTRHPPPPMLDLVQRAVIEGHQLVLGYVSRERTASERTIHPLGLATKNASWYLVADTDHGLRTFRVDRITSAVDTGEPVVRPPGFELSEAWRLITDDVDQLRNPLVAQAFAAPDVVESLRWVFGTRVRIGGLDEEGRVPIEVRGPNLVALAAQIAGYGAGIEVLDPPELRERLRQLARELSGLYLPA